jgi:uridine kinase
VVVGRERTAPRTRGLQPASSAPGEAGSLAAYPRGVSDPSPPPASAGPAAPSARIVLLAGPSGSGKSSLARRVGIPTVCLDDFYRAGDDPELPVCELGIVDWDDPRAWDAGQALATLRALAHHGAADVPRYDLAADRAVGTRRVELDGAPLVVAEGIFAAELIEACRREDLLADALCLTHRPTVTFWRRLVRDLREGRKPPLTLLRRGWTLLRQEPAIVARHVALGALPISGHDAERRLHRLLERAGDPVSDEVEDAA